MVRPEGVEPPTYWFVASCSIQLSYGRTLQGMQPFKDIGICSLEQPSDERRMRLKKLVRPERFELPTLWFEAKCSIQLSYGRENNIRNKLSGESAALQLRRSNRLRRGWRHEHRHLLYNVQPCPPQQLMDHWLRQPGGVIFYPHSFVRLIQFHAANAVNLAHLRHRQHG